MGKLSKQEWAHLKNPTTGDSETAKVVDEIWSVSPEAVPEISPDKGSGHLEAVFKAQLLEWPDGYRRVRFAYWTRRPGRSGDGWIFGQYAPHMSLQESRVIMDGIRERGWLEGVGASTQHVG